MKQRKRKWQLLILSSLTFILTACGTGPVTAESTGIWDRYIIYNLSQLIKWLSGIFGGNYAVGIIIFTIILLLLLTPLTKMQMDSQLEMAELQPELEKIKEKYPNKDRYSLEMIQQEQQDLMKAHGINQFAAMWPLLVQLPVMMALYQAILRTPELKEGTFLWMNLGERDPYFVMPLLAAALTYYSSYLSTKANPIQNGMTKSLTFIMPVFIFLISINFATAITLYWVISNAIRVIQILVMNNPYKIIETRNKKIQAEKDKQRELRKALKRATKKK